MAKAKKVTRKQLLKEPDEFITFSGRLIQFGMTYKKQLIYGLAALVLVLAVFSGMRYLNKRSENQASNALGDLLKTYADAESQKDGLKTYNAVADGFKTVLDKYANRSAGKLARLLFADVCYNAAKYDQAIAQYEKALKDYDDFPWVKDLALSGLAYCYEAKKDFATAAKYFQMVADNAESAFNSEALMDLGRVLAAAGDSEKSRATYQKLIKEHPDAMYIKIAQELVAQQS